MLNFDFDSELFNMARDRYHQLVKNALIAEGWTVTDDPLYIPTFKRTVQVDLGAERLIGAEKANLKIAVEIKSFIGLSEIHEFSRRWVSLIITNWLSKKHNLNVFCF